MSETTLVYRSWLPVPVETALAWHANLGAFERLTPPWVDVRAVDGRGTNAPGDWKRLRLGKGPVGIDWTLVHEASDGDAGFVDVQQAGPFRSWRHEHRFTPAADGQSVLEDRIMYALPRTLPGRAIADRLVQRQLEQTFRFRHRRTRTDLARHAEAGISRPLRIAVTGSSGMVGRQLVPFLRTGGHDVMRLVRRRPRVADEIHWDPATGQIDAAVLEGVDAVIHLAGVSIAGGRWTRARKEAIRESRVDGTRLLAETLAGLAKPPRVLVSASATGYYGDGGETVLTESAEQGSGFLADVCAGWEAAASPASDAGIRVVHPRFGIVLGGSGGMLAQLAPVFRLGLGTPLGSGQQWMSWIALDDLLGIVLHAVSDDQVAGPLNAVAPEAVTNAEFTETLAGVLHRPVLFRAPAPALRLVAGELADALLLASQRARPARLEEQPFRFEFPTLDDALRHELGRLADWPALDRFEAESPAAQAA